MYAARGWSSSPSAIRRMCSKEIPVFQTYGMTETSSQIVTLSPEDSLRKLGSAGKPLFPSQIKIIQAGEARGNCPMKLVKLLSKDPM